MIHDSTFAVILYIDHTHDILQIVLDELDFQKQYNLLYTDEGEEMTLGMLEDFSEEGMLPFGIDIYGIDLIDFITYYLVRQRDNIIN